MEKNEFFIKETIKIAENALIKNNHPFGALIVNSKTDEILMSAENEVNTSKDVTKHAELNLISMAYSKFGREILENCILYTSTEPCVMCSGAIYWSGIKNIVFSCSQTKLHTIYHKGKNTKGFNLSCREILNKGDGHFHITGPILENESSRLLTRWVNSKL
jgi:tRNA(Arg) A34 adenosine deaminase TadA